MVKMIVRIVFLMFLSIVGICVLAGCLAYSLTATVVKLPMRIVGTFKESWKEFDKFIDEFDQKIKKA